ncbi:MAG: DUF2316 family protein, partial [Brevundimonas sp.]
MSLNERERTRTSDELRANFELSGLTPAQLAADLELSPQELELTLAVAPGSRPEMVWALRDHLEGAILARGAVPHPYSRLTEQMRASAAIWFPLRDVSQP